MAIEIQRSDGTRQWLRLALSSGMLPPDAVAITGVASDDERGEAIEWRKPAIGSRRKAIQGMPGEDSDSES